MEAFPFFETTQGRKDAETVGPQDLDADVSKLNEYLQADKENSLNVESLYGDLQRRFSQLKAEWVRAETERLAMKKALKEARVHTQQLSLQNERLTAVLSEVHKEQMKLAASKTTVMEALGMGEKLNVSQFLNLNNP